MDFRAGMKIDYIPYFGNMIKGATIVKVFGSGAEPLLKCETRDGYIHFIQPISVSKVYKEKFDPAKENPNKTFKMFK